MFCFRVTFARHMNEPSFLPFSKTTAAAQELVLLQTASLVVETYIDLKSIFKSTKRIVDTYIISYMTVYCRGAEQGIQLRAARWRAFARADNGDLGAKPPAGVQRHRPAGRGASGS